MKSTKVSNAIMIGVIVLILSFLVFAFTSCQKDESNDFRDARTGKYRGSVTIKILEEGIYQVKDNVATVIKGSGPTELAISNLGLPIYAIAILNNSSYKYYPFSNGGNSSCDVTSLVTFNGTGRFQADSLYESGTMDYWSNGHHFTGTWETKMKKD